MKISGTSPDKSPWTMSKPLISIHDLTVRYAACTALEHVDLEILDDDFLGVIGPNGGGKTSLVRAIVGNIA